jgi:hypothetical protein
LRQEPVRLCPAVHAISYERSLTLSGLRGERPLTTMAAQREKHALFAESAM